MKKFKKVLLIVCVCLLSITYLNIDINAKDENTSKEEVVYINLNSDGSVNNIDVVNIFDLDSDKTIIDYGKYSSVSNMNTSDTINYENGKVSINAKKGKLYYEGKLENKNIPWDFNIKYSLDGRSYNAEELAGKSGKLKINISIKQNKDIDESFFKAYALQVTLTLDTNKASNIVTNGATIANVGSDKQITYTILSDNEKDLSLSADVVDFQMDGIAINGVRMDMDVDMDTSELKDKVNDIKDAVDDLNDGAKELNDAVSDDLTSGANDLDNGVSDLKNGANDLSDGIKKVYDGSNDLKNGLAALSSQNDNLRNGAYSVFTSLCTLAQDQINEELKANGLATIELNSSNYSEVLMNLLSQFNADEVYKEAYNVALQQVTAQVEANVESLYEAYINQNADNIYMTYLNSISSDLYKKAVIEQITAELKAQNKTDDEINAYLQSDEGQAQITLSIESLNDEQKTAIINVAYNSLTDEQKSQILASALSSLSDEQKIQIRNAYIEQLMNSDDVLNQINAAVANVNSSASKISTLKGQLDSYNTFYNGLITYTDGVNSAYSGSKELVSGTSSLYDGSKSLLEGVDSLKDGTGSLKDGISDLNEGTSKLYDGTSEFKDETRDIDTKIDDEIDDIKSNLTGSDIETISFVSSDNVNIKSVQFVIQTEQIKEVEEKENVVIEETDSSFFDKLLSLFKK